MLAKIHSVAAAGGHNLLMIGPPGSVLFNDIMKTKGINDIQTQSFAKLETGILNV